jgi:hypothetical protein
MTVETGLGLAAGIGSTWLFVLTEHHLGDRAMMPLDLYSSRPFVGLTLITFLLYAARAVAILADRRRRL